MGCSCPITQPQPDPVSQRSHLPEEEGGLSVLHCLLETGAMSAKAQGFPHDGASGHGAHRLPVPSLPPSKAGNE